MSSSPSSVSPDDSENDILDLESEEEVTQNVDPILALEKLLDTGNRKTVLPYNNIITITRKCLTKREKW